MDRDGTIEILRQAPQPSVPAKVSLANHSPTDAINPPKEAVHEYPQTPAGRVPLKDLMDELRTSQASRQCSPGDRVSWNNSPRTSEAPCSYATPAAKRGKKRAHSSSPASSQKRHGPLKPSFNLQNLQASLTSPEPDPVLDFEQRFYSRAKFATPSRPSASAAADFMPPSSPHTPALHSSGSAKLRRTKSCGVEWPEQKRRKVWKAHDHASQVVRLESPKVRTDENTTLHFLLDQIHHDLPSARHERARKPSSAPQPVNEVRSGGKHGGMREDSRRFNALNAVSSNPLVEEPVRPGQGRAAAARETSFHEVCNERPDPSLRLSSTNKLPQPPAMPQWPVDVFKNPSGLPIAAKETTTRLQPSQQDPDSRANNESAGHGPSSRTAHADKEDSTERRDTNPDVGEDDEDFMDGDLSAAEFEDVAQQFDERPSHAKNASGDVADRKSPRKPDQLPSQGIQAIAPEGPKRKVAEPLPNSSDDEFDDGTDFDAVLKEYERATQAGDYSYVREVKAHAPM